MTNKTILISKQAIRCEEDKGAIIFEAPAGKGSSFYINPPIL